MEVVDITDVTRDSKPIEIKLEDVASDMENPSESILKFLLEPQRSPNPTSIQHSPENSVDDGEFQYMCNTINEEVQIISCQGKVKEENKPREVINEVQKTVDSTLSQTVELVKPLRELTVGSNNEKVHNNKLDDEKCVSEETLNKSQVDGETNQNKYFFDRQVHQDEFIYKTHGYRCAHCLYLGSSWQDIKHHIRVHHRDPSIKKQMKQLKQCPHCPRKAVRIAEHIYQCHTESAAIKWLFCGHCDYKTKTKHSLLYHIQRKHIEFSELKCKECGKGFKIQRQLTDHIKSIHKPGPTVLFTCDSCNFKSRFKKCLQRHMLRHKKPEGETQRPPNPTSIWHSQENSGDDGEFQYMCNTINEEVQKISCQGNVEEENNPRGVINEVQKTVNSTLMQTVELVKPLSELAVESNNEKVHNDITIDDEKCVREETAEETLNKSQLDGETNQNKYFFDRQVHQDEFIYKTNGYICAHCLYLGSSCQDIKHHIRVHHRDPSIKKRMNQLKQCPHCPKKAVRIAEHIYQCHTESAAIKWLVCGHCDHKTKTKQSLLHHIQRKHIEFSGLKCGECGKGFKIQRQLTDHIKSNHKAGPMVPFTCDSCNFTSRFKKCLQRHMLQHNQPEGGFVCKKCDFRTQNFNKLRIHKKKEHSDWEQCHLCFYRSISKHTLNLHLIHHQDKKKEEDLIYKCDKCRYKTYRAYNLQMHKLSHKKPEEIDMFRCYHCDFKAKRKDNLKTHIFKHDMYKKILSCYICTYKTSSNYELKKHIDVHSEKQRREGKKIRLRTLTKLANGNLQIDGSEDKNTEHVTEQRKKVKNTKTSMDVKEESRKKLKRSCKKLDT